MVKHRRAVSQELAPSQLGSGWPRCAIGVSRRVARAAIILATGVAQRRQGVAHHVWGYTTVWGQSGVVAPSGLERPRLA